MMNTRDAVQDATTFDYLISGLRVRSAIELPSAIRAEDASAEQEIMILTGDVDGHLPHPESEGPGWALQGNAFLLHVPGVMRALIRDGNSIRIATEPDSDPGDVVLFLLGTCFAVLLHQRGRVVLHASAVAVGGYAMLFCGQSGAGKSTMAAMLSERGHPLLNDDVCNLSLDAAGRYVVYPDGRMLKLWARSLDHLQWEREQKARVRSDADKYYMAPSHLDLTPRPVGGVFMLQALNENGPATLQRLNAAESMAELTRNAYRPGLVHAMNMQQQYFAVCIEIQRNAGIYRLSRPLDFARAGEALDLLEEHWQGSVRQ